MAKNYLIIISDIHFERNESENQGKVIKEFFIDLEAQLKNIPKDSIYCAISGDLVNKAAIPEIYELFYESFIKKLLKLVFIDQIFVIPGNHDVNKTYVEDKYDDLQELLKSHSTEKEFNELVSDNYNILFPKFKAFKKFCQDKLPHIPYAHTGYYVNILPEISLFFLNTALCAFGGANKFKDKGHLSVDTAILNKWIEDNEGRTQILIMHHPLDELTSDSANEIKSLLKSKISFLFDGHIHTHTKDGSSPVDKHQFLHLGTPQLFSDKKDFNGYCILTLERFYVKKVQYRQWYPDFTKFMSAISWTGTEDGCYTIHNDEVAIEDELYKRLKNLLEDALSSYGQIPKWIERKLTNKPPTFVNQDNSKDENNINTEYDYVSIFNSKDDYQIIGGRQFGLTCYARYLSFKAWEISKKVWVYLSGQGMSIGNIERKINSAKNQLFPEGKAVDCLLIDDWDYLNPSACDILKKIKQKFPMSRIIIFSNRQDSSVINGIEGQESSVGFKSLYLREIGSKDLRCMVDDVTQKGVLTLDTSKALIRLKHDLTSFNLHRTPLQCLQLLLGFSETNNIQSVNRAMVMNRLLLYMFENPGLYHYKNGLAVSDEACRYIVGYVCEKLKMNQQTEFTEEEFLRWSKEICVTNKKSYDINGILDILMYHKIITMTESGKLHFKTINWYSYFIAARMVRDSNFREKLLRDHILYMPDIIEYYTGLDDSRSDIVSLLISELTARLEKVSEVVSESNLFKIYQNLSWDMNEEQKAQTVEQLEQSLKDSSMPDEIKDSISDETYDPTRPYFQVINEFMEEYGIRNFFQLLISSSRALRNSEFVNIEEKKKLLNLIIMSMLKIADLLYFLTPMLAKNGSWGYGGQVFTLTDDFPKDFNDCKRQIIVNIPSNIVMWFKDDIYADSLIQLLVEEINNGANSLSCHMSALIIANECAPLFKNHIFDYISQLKRNSYYLGILDNTLRRVYKYNYLTNSEQSAMRELIKGLHYKHKNGGIRPGVSAIKKVDDSVLPNRENK